MDQAVPAFLASLAASVAATRGVLGWLRRRQILDRPNDRSSHSLPTPRGGGLAVTPVAALGLWLAGQGWLAAGALALMGLSWIDDRTGLPALPRFLVHAGVVAAGLLLILPGGVLVFDGALPLWADRLLAGLGWLWFVNLYNFMDGIDGITGVETACLGLGIALCASGLAVAGLVLAGAGAGFLVWNWHPARLFLGDSGSVPLGFAAGGLLLQLAAGPGPEGGHLAAALILPAYYLADASITLLWRLKDGEKVWQAHRRHFYQRAVRGGSSHARVSGAVLVADVALVACARATLQGSAWGGVLMAVLVVAALLAVMTRWAKGASA